MDKIEEFDNELTEYFWGDSAIGEPTFPISLCVDYLKVAQESGYDLVSSLHGLLSGISIYNMVGGSELNAAMEIAKRIFGGKN